MFPTSTPLVPDDRYYEHEPIPRDLDESRGFGRQTAYRQRTIERPSPGKRILKSIVRLFTAVLIGVGLTLTWQSHGEEAQEFVGAWAPSLTWLLPAAAPKKPAEVVNSPELMQQMKLLAVDVAIVRRNVGQIATNQEQLAVKQDQMSKSIGTVQELAQEIREQAVSIPTAAPSEFASNDTAFSSIDTAVTRTQFGLSWRPIPSRLAASRKGRQLVHLSGAGYGRLALPSITSIKRLNISMWRLSRGSEWAG